VQRAHWVVRGKPRQLRGRHRLALGIAAVVTGAALAGGVLIGRATAPATTVTAAPVAPATGTRVLEGVDGSVRLVAIITPVRGWVRVSADVSGIPAGERCELVVVAKDGTEASAGGWLTEADLAGATVDGSALVAPEDVAGVLVRNQDGREFVSAST
jgi:hypothetical protein